MDLASPRAVTEGTSLRGRFAVSYAHVELLRFLAVCFGVGGGVYLIGQMIVALRRP